jgi:hypothetical protein
MKRTHQLVILGAAVLMVALPLRAQRTAAQRASRTAPAELPHNPDVLPQQVTFGQLIAAINGQPGHIARLKGMTDLQTSGVRLTNVAGLMVGNNAQALQTALERNSHSVTDMRAAVAASSVIMGMLRERELTPTNVVAVDVAANGTVWVFFRQ